MKNELLFVQIFFPPFHACTFSPSNSVTLFFCLSSHLNSFFPSSRLIHPIQHPHTTLNVESTFVSVCRVVRQCKKKNSNCVRPFSADSVVGGQDRYALGGYRYPGKSSTFAFALNVTPSPSRFKLLPYSWFFFSLGRFYRNFVRLLFSPRTCKANP